MRIDFLPASRYVGKKVPDYAFAVPDVFLPHLFQPEPVQVWYGSRQSAKSATKARELLARCASKQYFRGVYARQNQSEVKNSQYQLFKDIIDSKKWLSDQFVYRDSDYTIYNTVTNNMLLAGSFDNPQKIMSIADPTDIWVEEPITNEGQIRQKAFLSMFGSLRNQHDIPPRFHFTFNPISIDSWIYKDFFKNKTIPARTVLANYGDNPYCPKHALEFFEWLEKVDPDKYLVDALGQWGVPVADRPYFHRLTKFLKHYFRKCTYNPKHDVYLSFDFNVTNSVLVMQKYNGCLYFIDEFHEEGLDLKEVCKMIAKKYGRNLIHFTGDASGNNRSAYTAGNMSAWDLIKGYMKQFGVLFTDYSTVPTVNASTESSCFVSNALLVHFFDKCFIDEEHCPVLAADVKRMRRQTDGSLDKKDCDKNDYGHIGDCFRYALTNFLYSIYKQIAANVLPPNN